MQGPWDKAVFQAWDPEYPAENTASGSSQGSSSQSSASWLSQWKMHSYLANASTTGLFKIPEDFNCRKSLEFKSLIVFFALEAEH